LFHLLGTGVRLGTSSETCQARRAVIIVSALFNRSFESILLPRTASSVAAAIIITTGPWRLGKAAQIMGAGPRPFTIGIPGQKALKATRRVGYLRQPLNGENTATNLSSPCSIYHMDFGNWGQTYRTFSCPPDGTEPLRGPLVLGERVQTDAFGEDLGDRFLRGPPFPRNRSGQRAVQWNGKRRSQWVACIGPKSHGEPFALSR